MSEAKQSTSTYCQNTRCTDRPEGLSVLGFFPIRALVVVSSDRALARSLHYSLLLSCGLLWFAKGESRYLFFRSLKKSSLLS